MGEAAVDEAGGASFFQEAAAKGMRCDASEPYGVMSIHLGSVAHFTLAVTDLEKTAAWWLSLFDLEEYRRDEHRVLLGNDAILLAFFLGTPDPAALGHLAFHADGIDALKSARDQLRERGVPMEDPGDEIGPVGPGSTSLGLWFHDPDGYRWELFVRGPD